ncbi:hypothetical protein BV898_09439 [Hypsibius exemplaris]|uniref:AAA+ ATPase domain-containing protein n=1 Tax=Hypsibius exemplaris TaxID=2072580 RepID=A0A1W0WMM2_HYPEX|nr:hypothetical protein BV898_09439 [Hypsibius exemplaris]
MACFGSDSSRYLDELLQPLSYSATKKRKTDNLSASASTDQKKRRTSRGLTSWLKPPCVLVESSPERSPSPARIDIPLAPRKEARADPYPLRALNAAVIESVLADLETRGSSVNVRKCFERLTLLRQTCDRNDTWTSKYAPSESFSLLGNDFALLTLKTWLNNWKLFIEKNDLEQAFGKENGAKKSKRGGGKDKSLSRRHYADSSDEYCDDDDLAPEEMPLTGYMIYGPPGVGKTAAMHALAVELGFTVLEINPASCKDAKQILVQSLEATQSHRVHASATWSTTSHLLSQQMLSAKREDVARRNTLILIDDADVLPEGEEAFLTELEKMLKKTKRPVIFTISELSKIRLIQTESLPCGDLDFLRQPLVDVACYIILIALAESIVLSYSDAADLVKSTNGDLRSSINMTQFWWAAQGTRTPPTTAPPPVSASRPPSHDMNDTITLDSTVVADRTMEIEDTEDLVILPEVMAHMDVMLGGVCKGEAGEDSVGDSQTDSGIGSCFPSQLSPTKTTRRRDISPEMCDRMVKLRTDRRFLREFVGMETKSAVALITSAADGQFRSNCLSNNPFLAGVSEEYYEDAMTRGCCFPAVRRSMEISREYEEALVAVGMTPGQKTSLTGVDPTKSGRALYHRYGQFNPQIHVRGRQFGTEHWGFVRAMAYSELKRQQQDEPVKRRRARGFYNYLGKVTLDLPDELIKQISYRLGGEEAPEPSQSDPSDDLPLGF